MLPAFPGAGSPDRASNYQLKTKTKKLLFFSGISRYISPLHFFFLSPNANGSIM
jgi:hypothetical protein